MLTVLNHPIIEHKLSIIRNKDTGTKEFREIISELATFLCYEAFKNIELSIIKEIETPVQKTKVRMFDETKYLFIPILRAGLGMSEGITRIIPNAKFGHIGLYRDEETSLAHKYYYNVPNNKEATAVIIDPMLATGGSIDDAITMLKEDGFKQIKVLAIIAAPEGIRRIEKNHPGIDIYCAVVDESLNENNYIVPGLGDAGDRIFGTK